MHFSGIIASHRKNSHSRQFCDFVFQGVSEACPATTFDYIELCDLRIEPCRACGVCGRISGQCALNGDDFELVVGTLAKTDGILIVSPHYAPIPARLCALLERLESTHFFGHYYNPGFWGPLYNKPYGAVAHGAGPGVNSYKAMVLDTIENACDTIGLKIIRRDTFPENGHFVPASNSEDLTIFPPGQVYPDGYEEDLRQYGAFLARFLDGRYKG